MQSAYVNFTAPTMRGSEAQKASGCAPHGETGQDATVPSLSAAQVPSTVLTKITAQPWSPDDSTGQGAESSTTDEVVVSFHYSSSQDVDGQRVAHVEAAHLEFEVELEFQLQPEELASGDAFGLIYDFATEVRLLRAVPGATSDTTWPNMFIHTTRLSLRGWTEFESLEVLCAFDALEVLNLASTGIKAVAAIWSLKALRVLDISRCAQLEGTFEMEQLPHLRFLDVSETEGVSLSGEGCRALECVRATGRFMHSYMSFVDPLRKL